MKKLLRLFKDDIEPIDEDNGHIRGSTKISHEQKQNREIGKEVDAKIVYQYPKGAFRFPLVPDDDKQVRNRPDRPVLKKVQDISHERPKERTFERAQERTHDRTQERIHDRTQERIHDRTQERIHDRTQERIHDRIHERIHDRTQERTHDRAHERTRRHSPSVIRENRNSIPEQENRNSRPFKPTDIPSPIFGYKERPEIRKGSLHNEIVIEAAEKKDPINRELYHRYSQTWGGAPVIMKPGEKRFNPLDLSLSKVQLNNKEIAPPIVDSVERNAERPVEPIIEQEVLEIEASQKVTMVEENSERLESKSVTNEQKDFGKQGVLETVQENTTSSLIEMETIFESVSENDPVSILEESDAFEAEIAAAVETAPPSAVEEVPALEEESIIEEELTLLNQILNEEIVEEENEMRTDPDEMVDVQAEEPVRSAIPFNVIMLNQDKLRMMERELNNSINKIDRDLPKHVEETKDLTEMTGQAKKTDAQGHTDTVTVTENTVVIADQSFQIIANADEPEEPVTAAVEETVQAIQIHEDNEQETEETVQEDNFSFPSIDLLTPPIIVEENNQWIDEQKELLNTTLKNFNVGAAVVNVTQGPSVTRFEVQPEPGVKVNKITNLSDDIKLSLAARDIRIEAPIPGKHTIGIEVPNIKSRPVYLSEIVSNPEFIRQESPLAAALGLDISGKPVVSDLRKMPHGLIAGATGSGKSVCINTILVSFLYKAKPEDLKLLLIDPKMVELAPYNHIPHLVSPVITDVKAATAALKWAVDEMERRYELFAHTGVRDIGRFNELAVKHKQYSDKLPYIVIIIDELADLMMMSPADVEEAICRIAQKARACGIHLIIATQRPSVDVITGLIKANIPTRIAFSVSSQVDSRTIIDISGAEKLLGRGDMLFLENGSSKPIRLQGTFVSDEEIDDVVAHARAQGEPDYLFEQDELLKKAEINEAEDELFYEACEFVIENGGASSSMLQRRFKIGYNRAARLIDMMEQHGYISESRGSKPRDVFITDAELESLQMASKNL